MRGRDTDHEAHKAAARHHLARPVVLTFKPLPSHQVILLTSSVNLNFNCAYYFTTRFFFIIVSEILSKNNVLFVDSDGFGEILYLPNIYIATKTLNSLAWSINHDSILLKFLRQVYEVLK